MTISSLRIANFQNLAQAELATCSRGLNIISGDNGSGKTSLLESIYYLGLGRSFRSSQPARLVRHTTEQFSIFSHIVSESERQIPIGVERDLSGVTRLRVAEKDASSMTELAFYLPIRLINSQSHNLFESGPVFRRKFLDWGLFYQFESFLPCWRQFERVLKQRNMVLRDRRPKSELNPWTDELIKYGLELDALRRQYVLNLTPIVAEIAQELLDISQIQANFDQAADNSLSHTPPAIHEPGLQLDYQSGWKTGQSDEDYASQLANAWHEEMRAGHTLYGPHRADLAINMDGIPVKHFLSRGQQKLLICAMIIAQGRLLSMHANKRLITLVDDLPAELDLLSRRKLIALLTRQQTQIFITAIEHETICDLLSEDLEVPVQVFHVKHGIVTEYAHK